MFKAGVTLLFMGLLLDAQNIKKANIEPTPVGAGDGMFKEYCAVCHGTAGKGDGPAASALRKRPADLTQLARKNNGKFPELHVMNFITGEEAVIAHGSRDMPMWGQLFRSLSPSNNTVAKIRVNVLVDYIKSFQAQ